MYIALDFEGIDTGDSKNDYGHTKVRQVHPPKRTAYATGFADAPNNMLQAA
jgi:hypothetical protein